VTLGRPIALSGVLLAALVGCSPEARVGDDRGDRPDAGADQGSPDGGGLPGDGGLDLDAGPPRDLMCVDTGLPLLDVDYDGTMDELDLPSGSDRVRLRLRETAPGSFAGIMVFGERAPTPPDVEDPDRCDFVYCANGITSSDDPRIDLGGSPRRRTSPGDVCVARVLRGHAALERSRGPALGGPEHRGRTTVRRRSRGRVASPRRMQGASSGSAIGAAVSGCPSRRCSRR